MIEPAWEPTSSQFYLLFVPLVQPFPLLPCAALTASLELLFPVPLVPLLILFPPPRTSSHSRAAHGPFPRSQALEKVSLLSDPFSGHPPPHVVTNFFFLRFYLFIFRERDREGERERQKHQMCGCLSSTPHWGPGPQPRHVP